ncbi:MAG: undecaprenyl-diphosphatase [Rhizobiales bacterium 24-66-13]|nr:MAG: undecaprenyl-diphosphatase [Rhizobiales bacterium 12-66-7]OYZ83028.1 MAG: undecaprenyl-diphosphatase [Rhizobiales bacterium 24-66-13]OZB12275.1 MAG: undecaprenyl-diphosphatase [Rhizobiales bacterium 39-66-18]HQS44925.1 undecaprenyl-diphosphate phosphatase [Xanthobacteraceae bacterium]
MDWIAVALGVIEGITEFLPISSTGHLLIAEHWLGARSDAFNIAIQAGAMLAVMLIYRARLATIAIGWKDRANHAYAAKLLVSFAVTALLGFAVKRFGIALPQTLAPVAWALVIGGIWMITVEQIVRRKPDQSEVTWPVAIVVGVAQIVAGIFPGISRSGATIFAAMLFGTTDRSRATEFSFLVGIPTMFAATAFELLSAVKQGGLNEDWNALLIGFIVSAVTAFAAVKWLLAYIQSHRFTAFSIYRVVLGAALLTIS